MECEFYKSSYNSPLGEIILHSNGENLTALYFNKNGKRDARFCERNLKMQNLQNPQNPQNPQNLAQNLKAQNPPQNPQNLGQNPSQNPQNLGQNPSQNPQNLGQNLKAQNPPQNPQNPLIDGKKWLDLYFSGEIPQWTPKIAFPNNASAFALRVLEILRTIPHGKTTTYGAIAKQIAREFGIAKMSAQAVGGAVSRNPIAIIIPCHRILGANGNLTGYAGGIANKIALLKIEKIPTDSLKMPKIIS